MEFIRPKNKGYLRKDKRSRMETSRHDIAELARIDGDIVTFEWSEREGAVWNELYECWEGGEEQKVTLEIKGLGKVIEYKEDEMEYEWGRVHLGECLIRFPYDFAIEELNEKEGLRFRYKNQWWKVDSDLGVGDWCEGEIISKMLKGVKDNDRG